MEPYKWRYRSKANIQAGGRTHKTNFASKWQLVGSRVSLVGKSESESGGSVQILGSTFARLDHGAQ